jgi:hypothetical protein
MPSGDMLYVWQSEQDDGSWATISWCTPTTGVITPLVFRSREVADNMARIAAAHSDGTGQRIRLAEFALTDVVLEDV